jgi:uncharacterized protein YqjF (DUF2071 family)
VPEAERGNRFFPVFFGPLEGGFAGKWKSAYGDFAMPQARIFLTAEWRSLVMINYAIDPAVLRPRLPEGVELDLWQGEALVSMVGFLFLQTRVLGVPLPFHRDFEEVNLRFYVRRRMPEGWRRGVTFLREIVPKRAIAWTARTFYNEPYLACPMRHNVTPVSCEYAWRFGGRWNSLAAGISGEPMPIAPRSAEEFIFEHYWGYARQRDGSTVEYQVEHPAWRVWTAHDPRLDCDVAGLYGEAFAGPLDATPRSAFVAEGSPVLVRGGVRLGKNTGE